MNYTNLVKVSCPPLLLIGVTIFGANVAQAQEQQLYISGSWGISDPEDVDNDGSFTDSFTTGAVTGVAPLTIPSGAPIEWDSEYDTGDFWSLAFGWQFHENWRAELEYETTEWDVDSHENVTAGGIDLTDVDAGVLITGNVGDLGISVGDLVAEGDGTVEADTWFLNGYYDFANDSAWTPYLGLGVGFRDVQFNYRPRGVELVDEEDDVIAYQASAGVLWELTEELDLLADVRYVDGEDAEINSTLLPAEFDIAVESFDYRIGIKWNF